MANRTADEFLKLNLVRGGKPKMGKGGMDYFAIGMSHLPHGYRVEFRKALSGMHYGHRQMIQAPRPTTPKSLYIFLHECAHAYLHTGSGANGKRHVKEMEAELWAHAKMAEHGIPVPPEVTERAKQYVAYKIMQAERRGAKHIDPRALEFAGKERVLAKHREWEAVCGKSRHPNAFFSSGH